jgi:hypothetical protein
MISALKWACTDEALKYIIDCCIICPMNVLKTPQKWLYRLADTVAPRSEAEHHAQRRAAWVMIAVAIGLLAADILYRGL